MFTLLLGVVLQYSPYMDKDTCLLSCIQPEPEIRYGPSLPYGLFGDAAQFGEGDVQDLQQPVDHVRFVRADSMAVFAVAPVRAGTIGVFVNF